MPCSARCRIRADFYIPAGPSGSLASKFIQHLPAEDEDSEEQDDQDDEYDASDYSAARKKRSRAAHAKQRKPKAAPRATRSGRRGTVSASACCFCTCSWLNDWYAISMCKPAAVRCPLGGLAQRLLPCVCTTGSDRDQTAACQHCQIAYSAASINAYSGMLLGMHCCGLGSRPVTSHGMLDGLWPMGLPCFCTHAGGIIQRRFRGRGFCRRLLRGRGGRRMGRQATKRPHCFCQS